MCKFVSFIEHYGEMRQIKETPGTKKKVQTSSVAPHCSLASENDTIPLTLIFYGKYKLCPIEGF
jgi:hypothetical protein